MSFNRLIYNRLITALLCGLVLTLSGCASMNNSKNMELINNSLNQFRKAVRWGHYNEAARYIQFKDYTLAPRDTEYLANIRITAYEYSGKRFSEDMKSLEVVATISFYDVNHGSVATINEAQNWWYDEESKVWFLDGDIPDFTRTSRR